MTKQQSIHFTCIENGAFPNNEHLAVCIMQQVLPSETANLAEVFEQCFQENRWPPAWRNGLYDFHHFHSTAHEVLGVYSGWIKACFGGPGGVVHTATAGDVIVIPAGVSHNNMGQSADFKVVGAYPVGQIWNMRHGKQEERPQVDDEIRQVSLPVADPVHGVDGPLMKLWDV